MRCIFCKGDSSNSKSIEHIIPESLGNKEHVLPPGIVCDRCNNYFAREVEKPFLESLKSQRFEMSVQNKKGYIPIINGLHVESLTHIQLLKDAKDMSISLFPANEKDGKRFIDSISRCKKGTLILPCSLPAKDNAQKEASILQMPTIIEDCIISRFIAKVGLEALSSRILPIPGGIDEIINKKELDEIRRYARYGTPEKPWPCSKRKIYPAVRV